MLISYMVVIISGLTVCAILGCVSSFNLYYKNAYRRNTIINVLKKLSWEECSTEEGPRCGVGDPVSLKFVENAEIVKIVLYKNNHVPEHTYGLLPIKNVHGDIVWGTELVNHNNFLSQEEFNECEKYYDSIRIDIDYTNCSGLRKFGFLLLTGMDAYFIISNLYMFSSIQNPLQLLS